MMRRGMMRRGLCSLPPSWVKMATKELKGAEVEKLTKMTAEGIPVKPLYTAKDLPPPEELESLPGEFPFMRGPYATMYTHRPCVAPAPRAHILCVRDSYANLVRQRCTHK